ncbi:cytochrome P450 [Pelagibacterium sp. H642]|uniref:cytochrome P450 n=1 Tax=Pelagibacterium sp. H642 TaxID=1881069 RepID=UPI002814E1E9|nr:cytochrome P450 [Pelagibacterium sp. H642]WMT89567.1 cytochrome P450 [Pelagibacterium sp. H642]
MPAPNTAIPQLTGFDQTVALLREGYGFISSRCDALGTDIFTTRLMLKPVICVRGAEAAEMFYDGERFTRRKGAMPPTVLRLLQDKGSVQQLDGAAHRHRKAVFVGLLMDEGRVEVFLDLFRARWLEAIERWSTRPQIVLFDQANLVLSCAIRSWVGIPNGMLDDEELARDLTSMIENAGKFGPKVVVALLRRRGTERKLAGIIEDVRAGRLEVSHDAPLRHLAAHREPDGQLLSVESATVELLNILRPTVAIGRYIMFAALALKEHPEWPVTLMGADDQLYDRFAEEVRRLYPFFPFVGGIARRAFSWEGHEFAAGDWVLLDLHGTNHDPRLFPRPRQFDPHRDISWRYQDHAFIPQGGGDARITHRCPGEAFTVAAIREATRLLVEEMEFTIPQQDLEIAPNRIPARPPSGLVLTDVRRRI